MDYETDPVILAAYTDDQWTELLARVAVCATVPRKIIRVKCIASNRVVDREARRAFVMQRLAEGHTGAAIAKELGVTPSMVTKIKSGAR